MWTTPGQYFGDKCARTMEEAFGPGARLDVEPDGDDPLVCLIVGAVIVVGSSSLIGIMVWLSSI